MSLLSSLFSSTHCVEAAHADALDAAERRDVAQVPRGGGKEARRERDEGEEDQARLPPETVGEEPPGDGRDDGPEVQRGVRRLRLGAVDAQVLLHRRGDEGVHLEEHPLRQRREEAEDEDEELVAPERHVLQRRGEGPVHGGGGGGGGGGEQRRRVVLRLGCGGGHGRRFNGVGASRTKLSVQRWMPGTSSERQAAERGSGVRQRMAEAEAENLVFYEIRF